MEHFILFNGGIYTALLWIGFVLGGSAIPLVLLLSPIGRTGRWALATAATLVPLGAIASLSATVIGGEAFPEELFPGKPVSSSFFDGVVNPYTPSLVELLLGLGGLGVAGLIVAMGSWVSPLLPDRAGDETTV